MEPFYNRDGIIIYLGDSRQILPKLSLGTIVTDPPYPDYYADKYDYFPPLFLDDYPVHQMIFWSAKASFPLDYTAIHIWDKKTGAGSEYERVFERNGAKNFKVFRHYLINSTVAANFTRDVYTGHKSQKPTALMVDLIKKLVKAGPIIDPFMGSGATLEAAYKLGYDSIGIEKNEDFANMAVKRLSRLPLRMPNNPNAGDAQSSFFDEDTGA